MKFFRRFKQLQDEVALLSDSLERTRTDLRRRLDKVEHELGIVEYTGFSYVRRVTTRSEIEELHREIEILVKSLGLVRHESKTLPAHYAPKAGPEKGE